MKNIKPSIVLDFDDTLVNSSIQIINMLNQKYKLNKTIADLTDWNYSSIYSNITPKEVIEMYASPQFFNGITWGEGARLFLLEFSPLYKFIICSKGSLKNLELKKAFLTKWFTKMQIFDWEFVGIENDEEADFHLDKSSIDFSETLFCVDDNTNALLSINSPKKFLIKNYKDCYWNKTPINREDVYVINNFYDLIKICKFDEYLRKEGVCLD